MKQTVLPRRLLQVPVEEGPLQDTVSPSSTESSPDPIFQSINGSGEITIKRSVKQPTSPLDSSMALTILVLLAALFFLGFFSIYLRRFAEEDSAHLRRRRNPAHPTSAGLYSNRQRNGLDPSTVRSLPLVSYGEEGKQLISVCPICLSEFEEREIVKLIPHCAHVFHPNCIDTWLRSHLSCPLCRSTQFFKKADEELCWDVKEEDGSSHMSRTDGASTADDADTWREVKRAVGIRRNRSSSTSMPARLVLPRSMSF